MPLPADTSNFDDTVIQEIKIRSTKIDIILLAESSEFNEINFAIETTIPQIYSRPRVLITSCRKQRRNSIALARSIQAILEDIVIQESKTKSTNIDINLLAESTEVIGLMILQLKQGFQDVSKTKSANNILPEEKKFYFSFNQYTRYRGGCCDSGEQNKVH